MTDTQNPRPEQASVPIDMAVGKVVAKQRKLLDLKLREVARMSGISAAMVSRIENGLISPSLSTLQALADTLSVPVISFFEHTVQTADINFVRAGEGISAKRIAPNHVHDFTVFCRHKTDFLELEVADITLSREDNGTHPVYFQSGYVLIRVLSGSCIYSCGNQKFEMNPGDVLSFNAELRHGAQEVLSPQVTFMSVFTRNP